MTLPKWGSVLWSYKHTCQITFEKPKKKLLIIFIKVNMKLPVFALLHFVIVLLLIISTNELDLTVYISIMNSKSDECCFRSGQIILKTYKWFRWLDDYLQNSQMHQYSQTLCHLDRSWSVSWRRSSGSSRLHPDLSRSATGCWRTTATCRATARS